MSGPSSNLTPALVIVALFVVILVRRTVLLVQGARYSTGRLIVFSAFYVLLYVALAGSTIAAAVALWGPDALLLLLPYAGAVAAATLVALPYVRHIVRFEERGPGEWYYRMPWLVPVIYLVLFLVRFATEIVVFGPAAVTSFTFPTVSAGLLELLIGIDLLYSASTGLLVARGVGVYQAHQKLVAGSAASTAAPPASRPLP